MTHPDFGLLGDRFSVGGWTDRVSAIKFAFESITHGPLESSTLREPLLVALYKDIIHLFWMDSDRLTSFITRDEALHKTILSLKGHDLLARNGFIDEAIRMRAILNRFGSSRAQFSNPTDPHFIAVLSREPQMFFQIFDEVNAATLPALFESHLPDLTLISFLRLGSDDLTFLLRLRLIQNALVTICCTLPDVKKYAHQMMVVFHEVMGYISEFPSSNLADVLILAYELRGLVSLKNENQAYPPILIEAAFLGGRFDVVLSLLSHFSENKIVEFIQRDAAFEQFLFDNPESFSQFITDRNVFSCQSRKIFAAFHQFPSFMETLRGLKNENLKSLTRFVGPKGTFEEISTMFPRLLTINEKWNFLHKFLAGNETPDCVRSLKFLLSECTFGFDRGRSVSVISKALYARILAEAPELIDELRRGPFGIQVTFPTDE